MLKRIKKPDWTMVFTGAGKARAWTRPRPRGGNFRSGMITLWSQWHMRLLQEAKMQKPEKPLDGPLRMRLDFFFPRTRKVMPSRWFTKYPDLSNLEKGVEDMLQHAGVIVDDKLICWSEKRKEYSSMHSMQINLWRLED